MKPTANSRNSSGCGSGGGSEGNRAFVRMIRFIPLGMTIPKYMNEALVHGNQRRHVGWQRAEKSPLSSEVKIAQMMNSALGASFSSDGNATQNAILRMEKMPESAVTEIQHVITRPIEAEGRSLTGSRSLRCSASGGSRCPPNVCFRRKAGWRAPGPARSVTAGFVGCKLGLGGSCLLRGRNLPADNHVGDRGADHCRHDVPWVKRPTKR